MGIMETITNEYHGHTIVRVMDVANGTESCEVHDDTGIVVSIVDSLHEAIQIAKKAYGGEVSQPEVSPQWETGCALPEPKPELESRDFLNDDAE